MIQTKPQDYSYRQIGTDYYVYYKNDKDIDFTDGPMSLEEAEILTENFNEVQDATIDDPNPIIRDFVELSSFLTIIFNNIDYIIKNPIMKTYCPYIPKEENCDI